MHSAFNRRATYFQFHPEADMINQSEFFDSIAEKWDSMELDDIQVRLARVVREAGIGPGMEVLDVGSGTGALIACLVEAMNGSGRIRAIDISAGMLKVAAGKGFPDNVTFVQADLMDLETGACVYDRVMCNAVLPHFIDKPAALAHIFSLLRPGGLVVISHPTGREAVNRIHREAGSVVADDRVPNPSTMRGMLEDAGFADISVTDEPEFYLAIAARPH
jgi:demethylmenaquinone methyltransferase/2-methoxy-6-polyprenyl-1,4-benzoquinol methylase